MFLRKRRRRQSASIAAAGDLDRNKGEVVAIASTLVSGTKQFIIKIRLDSGGLDTLQLTPHEASDVAFVKRGDRVEYVRWFNFYCDSYCMGASSSGISSFRIVTAEAELDAA